MYSKLYYISDARLPTEKAHGLAIMKQCEALATAGTDIELVVPNRRNTVHDDPFMYYGIKRRFPLIKLWTLDLIRFGYWGFLIQEFTFALSAARYLPNNAVLYSRDDVSLAVLSFLGYRRFVWESHTGAWNPASKRVARLCEHLVVISQGLKDFYVSRGIPAEKIRVLPSAIDLDDFAIPVEKRVARERLALPPDKKIALYIGRLDGWKGTDTLFEASHFLPENIQIAVVGSGADIGELQQRYPRVLFLGPRPYRELASNQAAADVLVVPNTGKDQISARFTSPLKLVAHMASGIPIVASDLPSIRELTGDDCVLLVQPDYPMALADGIKRLLDNPALGAQLAANAKEKVQQFSWKTRATSLRRFTMHT